MRRPCTAGLLAGALMLTACSASAPPGSTLPGPVPEGVEYREIDTGAAALAPDADVTLLDGTTVALSELWSDRPVLLAFTESWCDLCVEAQAELNDVVATYGDAVTVVALAERSDVDELTRYADENDVAHLIARDPSSTAWRAYAVSEPPFLAVIGQDGVLLRGWRGVVHNLDEAVEALLVAHAPQAE